MKNKKVFFLPKSKDVEVCLPEPLPSSKYIPQWFKKMPFALADIENKKMDSTAKKCMPFIDSLTSGYTQELICDLEIKNHGTDEKGNDILSYNWAGNFKPCSTRLEDTKSSNVFNDFYGYYNTEFHWNTYWEPKTPSGYSSFYYHPANRLDLPFTTLNAIIDTDKWSVCGPVPFMIKKGFEGVIPAGTPIYQMIFIKREKWDSSKSKYDESFQKYHLYNLKKFLKDGYKKQYWSKKEYN